MSFQPVVGHACTQGAAGRLIRLDMCNGLKSGLDKAFGQTSGPGKQVKKSWLTIHDVTLHITTNEGSFTIRPAPARCRFL